MLVGGRAVVRFLLAAAGAAVCCLLAALPQPARAADYKISGNRMIMSGAIYGEMEFDRFAGVLRSNPAVTTIVMKDFQGGMTAGGFLNYTKFIRDHGLATEVDGPCMSACALAFLGGVKRGVAPGADLDHSFVAFHGVYNMGGSTAWEFEGTFINALRRYTGGRMPAKVARTAFALPQNGLAMFFDRRAGKDKKRPTVIFCRDLTKKDSCVGLTDIDAVSTGVFTR